MRILDHVQGGGDLMDVRGHADHVQDGVLFGQNILLVITAFGIGHHAEFQGGLIAAHHPAQRFLRAIFPVAMLAQLDAHARGLVAQLTTVRVLKRAIAKKSNIY